MTDDVQATAHPATAQPASRQAATEPVTQPQAAKPGGDPARNESVVTRLMRAGSDEVDALLEALGMREQLSGEAQDIARLVERRLAEVAWGDRSTRSTNSRSSARSLCTGSSGR